MNFSENTNLLPGGQSASPSKLKELDNKIDDLAQTVTSVADSVADLADEVTTAELNATDANITNAVIDNATVGEETVTTVNATTANADNLNATDADITNLTADDVEANSVDADNGYFGSVNAQSFTGQNVNVSEDVTASAKVQGKTVQATEKVVTPALESTQTELKGATTVRGDVYFPENGDKIFGEYLEVEANKVDANTVKANSLTTETPTGSSQLVGYDANGKLIPVDAGLDPSNYWELVPNDQTSIQPKDNKKIEATEITTPKLNAEDIDVSDEVYAKSIHSSDALIDGYLDVGIGLTVANGGDTTLRDTEVDGDLTVNGDIIQNGSAYETHAEKVYSKNDLIITRDGAVSGLSTGQYTGIQAKKYDGTNDGQLVFDKDGEARVGDVGDTEPLMTRDELADMTDGSLLKWDGTNKKAVCAQSADIIPSDASTRNYLVTKHYVSAALAEKQDTLTFDDEPTEDSSNPVKSSGVYNAVMGKKNFDFTNVSTTTYLKFTDLHPTQPHATNVYIVTAKDGSSLIITCGTNYDGSLVKMSPNAMYIKKRTILQDISVYFKPTDRTIVLGIESFTAASIIQIGGVTKSKFLNSVITDITGYIPVTITPQIPDIPTNAGTYNLQCVVTSNNVYFQWA